MTKQQLHRLAQKDEAKHFEFKGREAVRQAREREQKGPAFTLVAHDRLAPATIRDWALRAARLGSSPSKIGQAVLISVEMEKWQVRYGSKVPD